MNNNLCGLVVKCKNVFLFANYNIIVTLLVFYTMSPYCVRSMALLLYIIINLFYYVLQPAGRPGSSEVPRNPLTRWDVSSIPANGIFLTEKLKNKIKMPNGWRTIKIVSTQNSTSQSTRERNG